nr:hypothetical protein [Tanacetum cinerariifolium]
MFLLLAFGVDAAEELKEKNTKCFNAAGEELSAAKHKLILLSATAERQINAAKQALVGLKLLLILLMFLLLAFGVDAAEELEEKNTKCFNAAGEELSAAKHKLILLSA